MKTVLRTFVIVAVSVLVGVAMYTIVQPVSPAVSFDSAEGPAAAGTYQGPASDAPGSVSDARGAGRQGDPASQAAGGQQVHGTRPGTGPNGKGGHPVATFRDKLDSVLLVLAKVLATFVIVGGLRLLAGKRAAKRRRQSAITAPCDGQP